MQILEAHHFRLPACRFILDLFDKRVLEQIVLEEEDEDEGEDEDEEEIQEIDRAQFLRTTAGGYMSWWPFVRKRKRN